MTGRPKVSIGLPVHNGERHIGETIRSILDQTLTDFELVIVDNASTDRTKAICEEFAAEDPRILYSQNLKNIGAGPNFNLSFTRCRGEYFKWAAHDDLLDAAYLESCVGELDREPSAVVCNTEIDLIDDSGTLLGPRDEELTLVDSDAPSERFRDLILGEHWCIDIFGVMRRKVLDQTPLIGSFIGSDRVLLAELGLRGRFLRVPRTLFHSRDHAGRSIRAIDIRSRASWFDPELGQRIVFPFWRTGIEYVRAIRRIPLPATERRAALVALLPWLVRNRWRLETDLREAFKYFRDRRSRPRPGPIGAGK